MRRYAAWAAALFICCGTFLRVYRFWSPPLWRDEYGTWWVVASGGWREVVHRALHVQGQSPVYYLMVRLSTLVFGTGPFGLRLPSIIFGIVTLVLAYPLGRALFKQRYAAVFMVATAAVSPPLLWYSQEARPYAFALCCVVVSFLCYLRLLEDADAVPWRIGYVLAAASVFYAHYVFAFVVVIQMAHLLLVRGRTGFHWREWSITLLALGLLCLPAAPQLASLAGRRAALDWAPPATWSVVLHLLIAYLDLPLLVILGVVTLLIGVSTRQARALFNRISVSLLVVWVVLPIVAFGVASRLLGVTLLFDRYVLFILPASLLIVAGVGSLGRREGWWRLAPFATLLVFTLAWNLVPSIQRTGSFASRYNEDWAGAVASLEKVAAPDDVILYSTGFVEADQLALPNPDPMLLDFINAPLTAHLRAGRQSPILGLPFRINDQTSPYVRSLLARAAGSPRVVIIGVGNAARLAAIALIRSGAFAPPTILAHGSVSVIVLERKGT